MKKSGIILSLLILSLLFCAKCWATKVDGIDIRIRAEIQKEGYVGEVFSYNVILESDSPEIANVRVTKSPEFPANMKLINGVTKNSKPSRKEEKGKTVYVWNVFKTYIIPDRAGKFNIGKVNFIVFIPEEKIIYDNFWGNFRTVEYKEVNLECNAVSFKVKNLPSGAADKIFSNCVGDFKVEGWFPPGKISVGNDAYAIFTISGYGSLENLKVPNLYKLFDTGCHLKEVEQTEQRLQRDGKLFSEITLTCTFIAEEEEFQILPLCIEVFNPEIKEFETVCSDKLHWTSTSENKNSSHKRKEAIEI